MNTKKLSMGFCYSSDIFQEKTSELFEGFGMVHAYIYDLIVITENYFQEYKKYLEKFEQRLEEM